MGNKVKINILRIIFVFIATGIIAFACSKKHTLKSNDTAKSTKIPDNAAPPNPNPTYSLPTDVDAQIRHLARGFAVMINNESINSEGRAGTMTILQNSIPSGDEEVAVNDFEIAMESATPSPVFNIGGVLTSNLLYDGISYDIQNFPAQSPPSPAWDQNFYYACSYAGVSYNVDISIPDINIQGDYTSNINISKPVAVVAERFSAATGYSGYYWDPLTASIKDLNFTDMNAFEDFIDLGTYYVVVINLDEIGNFNGSKSYSDCTEQPNCNDGYCDKQCGESDNCPDCSNANANKILKVTQLQITEDLRYTGPSDFVIDKYFENQLHKYNVVLNAAVLHGNGKWEACNDYDVLPKWKQKEVPRTHIKNSGAQRHNGGVATWNTIKKSDDGSLPNGIVIANRFNPYMAKVYICFYEKDHTSQERNYSGPLWNGTAIGHSQSWKSRHMTTLTGIGKASFYKDDTQNGLPWVCTDAAKEVLPSDWLDPAGHLRNEIEITANNCKFKLTIE